MVDEEPVAMEAMRLAYAPSRGEGENACVIGPRDEIVCEMTEADHDQQWLLATKVADFLNDTLRPVVADMALIDDRARLLLLIIVSNGLRDRDTIAFVNDAIDAADISFVRQQCADLTQSEVLF